jgi:hypothetical protein
MTLFEKAKKAKGSERQAEAHVMLALNQTATARGVSKHKKRSDSNVIWWW